MGRCITQHTKFASDILRSRMIANLVTLLGIICLITYLFLFSLQRRGYATRQNATEGVSRSAKQAPNTTRAKQLYHRLQNPSRVDAEIVHAGRSFLAENLERVLCQAGNSHASNILKLAEYSPSALVSFVAETNARATDEFSAYLARRDSGGCRELLLSREHAAYWLEQIAPVKLIDGAWLARLHHAETPAQLRAVTRVAWQILSEELGDGDLRKNHVHLYRELLKSCGSELPPGDSSDFIDARINPNPNDDIWTAAALQLCLGLFPDRFLSEVLGFTLAYECVTTETLVCAHELRELGLDPKYFNLHITIDNADSGHTAMALNAVMKFFELCDDDRTQKLWMRVKAGYLLAIEISGSPPPLTSTDLEVLRVFSNKLEPGRAAHMSCNGARAGLGGMALTAWLDPRKWESRKFRFLSTFSHSRWIARGDAANSRFMREISWGGCMFGAFTARERATMRLWIENLRDPAERLQVSGDYRDHISAFTRVKEAPGALCFSEFLKSPLSDRVMQSSESALTKPISQHTTASLVQCTLIPLQYALASPSQAATDEGMLVLRVLRALNGFSSQIVDVVDGMDGLGYTTGSGLVDIQKDTSKSSDSEVDHHTSIEDNLDWSWLHRLSKDPQSNMWFLLGVQYGLIVHVVMNETLLRGAGLAGERIISLNEIGSAVSREISQSSAGDRSEYQHGFAFMSKYLRL
ncbi:hypothetical protein F4678DRAFT_54038 [Xylaria arbuscula]|nr:hypothetical protein F4678DRAFT_54038 [Xylaria arbuscula]